MKKKNKRGNGNTKQLTSETMKTINNKKHKTHNGQAPKNININKIKTHH